MPIPVGHDVNCRRNGAGLLYRKQRTRGQIAISIATAIVIVSILALLEGTLDRTPRIVATSLMSAAGLVGIYLFDQPVKWSWFSDVADFLTIVGLLGLWGALTENSWGWLIGIVFYWGLSTIARRMKHGT